MYGQQPQGYGYGHYPPPPPPPKKGPGVLATIGIVIACMFGGCVVIGALGSSSSKKAESTPSTERPAPEVKAAAPIAEPPPPKEYTKVTAAQLIKDYKANEVAADESWKSADVEVTGVVKDISKGPLGGIHVTLGNGNEWELTDVRVTVKRTESSKAAKLAKGTKSTLRGKVTGMVLKDVLVDDAEIL